MYVRQYMDCVYEGNFQDNELTGFGRHMTSYWNGQSASYMGYFKNGLMHGYGKWIHTTGEIREGIFENDN